MFLLTSNTDDYMWGKNRCPQEKKKKKRFVLVSKILKNQSANIKKLKTKKIRKYKHKWLFKTNKETQKMELIKPILVGLYFIKKKKKPH